MSKSVEVQELNGLLTKHLNDVDEAVGQMDICMEAIQRENILHIKQYAEQVKHKLSVVLKQAQLLKEKVQP